jgi:hypothetical protein
MNNTSILWEEKNSIEQSKKSENKPIFVLNDGISETKNASVKSECKDTGDEKRWVTVCPDCGKEKYFHTKRGFERGVKYNTRCLKCKSRTKNNYVGVKFGRITITNQYYLEKVRNLKVDYICDCGNKTINKSFTKVKKQKMCLRCRKTNAHKINKETSFNMLFNDYVRSAKIRHLDFSLTREKFAELTKEKCFYCGSVPSSVMRKNAKSGSYVYNGIDRRNSNIGYMLENSVSCCKLCNCAKRDLSIDDFINHIKKIYEYQFVENKR